MQDPQFKTFDESDRLFSELFEYVFGLREIAVVINEAGPNIRQAPRGVRLPVDRFVQQQVICDVRDVVYVFMYVLSIDVSRHMATIR